MRLTFLMCACLLFVGCGPSAWDARVSYEGQDDGRRSGCDDFASDCSYDGAPVIPTDRTTPDTRPFGRGDNPDFSTNQVVSALVSLIRETQMREVGVSSGKWDYECFTDEQLAAFLQRDVPGEVRVRLLNDRSLRKLVSQIRTMPRAEIDLLLQRARETYRPTWEELGQISPDGQTTAGQRADRLIANAIVDVVVTELRKGPP